MKWLVAWTLLAGFMASGLMAGTPTPGRTKADRPAAGARIAGLAWIAGHWRLEDNGRVVEEIWLPPAGGALLGMGRTIARGREQEHAFLQIREGPGGDLFFIAQRTGQKEATFLLMAHTDSEVVFQNQLQEFPQTITYTLLADGNLRNVLEGPGPAGETKRAESRLFRRMNP